MRVITYDENGSVVEDGVAADDPAHSNRDAIDVKLDQALDAMRAHVARGTFTAAQRDGALLLVLRVCIGLVRVVRNRYDAAD